MSKEIELCNRCQDNPIDEWDTGKPYKDIYENKLCFRCWVELGVRDEVDEEE